MRLFENAPESGFAGQPFIRNCAQNARDIVNRHNAVSAYSRLSQPPKKPAEPSPDARKNEPDRITEFLHGETLLPRSFKCLR